MQNEILNFLLKCKYTKADSPDNYIEKKTQKTQKMITKREMFTDVAKNWTSGRIFRNIIIKYATDSEYI